MLRLLAHKAGLWDEFGLDRLSPWSDDGWELAAKPKAGVSDWRFL